MALHSTSLPIPTHGVPWVCVRMHKWREEGRGRGTGVGGERQRDKKTETKGILVPMLLSFSQKAENTEFSTCICCLWGSNPALAVEWL